MPGDPSVIRSSAGEWTRVATQIGTASTKLRNVLAEAVIVAEFAVSLQERADEVSDRIARARERYDGAADAVRGYAAPLENAQAVADQALADARLARGDLGAADNLVEYFERELRDPNLTPEERLDLERRRRAAEADLDAAGGALDAARRLLQTAIDSRNTAAQTAIAAMDDVNSAGGLNDAWWDDVAQWMRENDELLDTIMFWVGVAGAVLTIILLAIPGVNLIAILIVGIVFAAIAVINAVAQASAGSGTWGEAALEIGLALLPFGLGRIASSAARVGVNAIKQAAVSSKMGSMAGQKISGWTIPVATEWLEQAIPDVLKPSTLQRLIGGDDAAEALAEFDFIRGMDLVLGGQSAHVAEVAMENVWRFAIASPMIIEPAMIAVDALDVLSAPGEALQNFVENGIELVTGPVFGREADDSPVNTSW